MLANHRLARAISDAGWAQFARLLGYKQAWRVADRVFTCGCGYSADRDCNAAVNLARWGQQHHLDPRTPKQRGRATNARRRDGADQHPACAGETSPDDAGTDVHTAPAA